jgi:SAM-dependent methyltransferase
VTRRGRPPVSACLAPGRILGCGTGAGLRVLTPLCRGPVTGVDFSAGMLAQARGAHPGAGWVRADARALPFAEAFDLAVSFGALGHFLPAERPALFAGIYRALRPGGIFAFPRGHAGAPVPDRPAGDHTALPAVQGRAEAG